MANDNPPPPIPGGNGSPKNQRDGNNETVIVACKLPNGLRMRLFVKTKVRTPAPNNQFVEEIMAVPDEEAGEVVLNGFSHAQNVAPKCEIIAGFAITKGVKRQFWEKWREQNAKLDAVKNGLIFAWPDESSLRDNINDHEKLRSGLERLDPTQLPDRRIATDDTLNSNRLGQNLPAIA